MLLTCYPETVPKNLPQTVKQFSYVPFSYLLPRASALVDHAVTGTAALCMRAGLPQIVMPMAYDQPDFAACLARLGVAKVIKPSKFTGPALARAMDVTLNSSKVADRCRSVAALIKDSNPIEQICDAILETPNAELPKVAKIR